MTGLAHLVVGLCFLGRLAAPPGRETRDAASADGLPSLMVAFLATGRIMFGRDPLDALGLDAAALARVPWAGVLVSLLGAFAANRAIVALALRPHLRRLVASGAVNPGGTYAALAGTPLAGAAVVAAAMTGSQTFFEEFVFRGVLFRGLAALAGLAGSSRVAAVWCGVIVSALSFGLAHFIPAKRAAGKGPRVLSAYALVWPAVLGGVFCALDESAQSIWPGWIIHWVLNYSVFLWDRGSHAWEGAHGSC